MKAWLARALEIRDTVAALPPLPASIWAGGVAIALVAFLIRVALVTRLIRRGSPAPAETRRLVQAAAIRLSVSPVPETVIVSDRVSPMIWCGLRPRLVLPEGLWNELDDASRFAVLVHELAHLRRRDHRLCWIEFLIGIVYWWHPAAWWARRRVRDEADLCCDAWVTSIIPQQRRAYAEALVATKSYLSVPGRRVTPGLGMMTGRTKRMARRLTMVMTQRVAPRTSALGATVALAVLAAGMFVTPGLACPPESQGQTSASTTVIVRGKATKEAQKAKAMQAEQAAKAKSDDARAKAAAKEAKAAAKAAAKTSKPAKAKDGAAPEFFGEAPALEAMKAGRGRAAAPRDTSEDAEIRRLEEQLRVLEQRIDKLYDKAGRQRSSIDVITPRSPFAATTPAPAMAPSPAVFSRRAVAPTVAVPAQPAPRGTPVPAIAPFAAPTPIPPPAEPGAACAEGPLSAPIAPTAPAAPGAPTQPAPPAPAREPALLSLAPLQTQGLTGYAGSFNLEPQSIIAVAEPADETEARSYILPDGKLEALTELMARQDVPVLIERHDDKIVVHATSTQHEVFAAFVHLINPESPAANLGSLRRYMNRDAMTLNRALVDQTGRLNELAAMGRAYEAVKQPRLAQLQSLEHYRSALGHLNVQRESIENQAEQLREEAENLREMAEKLREKAEALRERIQSRTGDTDSNAVDAATTLMARAATTDTRAFELDARADALDSEVAGIESAADQLDDEIEALADQIEDQIDVDVDVDIDEITGQIDVQFDHDDADACDHEDCDDSCDQHQHDDCDHDSDSDHDDDSDSDSDTH